MTGKTKRKNTSEKGWLNVSQRTVQVWEIWVKCWREEAVSKEDEHPTIPTDPVVGLGVRPDVVVGVLVLLLLALGEPGVVPACLVWDQVHDHSLA